MVTVVQFRVVFQPNLDHFIGLHLTPTQMLAPTLPWVTKWRTSGGTSVLVRVALGPRMSASTSCSGGHRIWIRSRLRSAVVSSSSKQSCRGQSVWSEAIQLGRMLTTVSRDSNGTDARFTKAERLSTWRSDFGLGCKSTRARV